MLNLRVHGSTTNVAEVALGETSPDGDYDLSKQALRIRPGTKDASNATTRATGGLRFNTEDDTGQWTGSFRLGQPETSVDYRLRCGLDTLLFFDNFNMIPQNTGVWKTVLSTMTLTAGGGFLLFNTGLTAATNNGVAYTTWRTFSLLPETSLIVEGTFTLNSVPQANQVFEFGLFLQTTAAITPPVDGAYFRVTADGLAGILNYGGIETSTGDVVQYDPVSNLVMGIHTYYMEIDNRATSFWLDDVLIGRLVTPPGSGAPFMTTALPLSMQQRNTGTVLATPLLQVKCSGVAIYLGDLHTSKPWPYQMAGMEMNSAQFGNGTTPTLATASNAFYANSLVAGAGVAVTNTTSAITANLGLGGQMGVLPTLAVPQDGCVCNFLNPVGTVNIAPRTLCITGVRVQGAVTTTLTNAAPLIYAYSLCYGHTSASLAQTETGSFVTATTKAPRRIPLGFETYTTNCPAGTLGGQGIYVEFATPIVINPGENIAIAAKNLGTVVSTTGVVNVLVMFNGYFE